MNSLLFLTLCSAKNTLLELRRKPGKLALYIIVILFIALMIFVTVLIPEEAVPLSDIVYLKGIIFAFFMMFFISAVVSGLSQGAALFAMEDVNLLFVSPVNPRAVLLYGVFRVVKTLALASVFILFQGVNLRRFGVDTGGLFILYAGYLLMAVVSQLISLLIYSVTNGRKNRQLIVKIISVLIFVPLIVTALWQLLKANGDYPAALRAVLGSDVMSYTPVLGWASAGIVAFITGEYAAGALFFSLLFLAGAASVGFIYIGKPDYYEDVLVASETMFERKRNLAEGKLNTVERNSKRRVKIKATGISGLGASALFGKHIRESFRANRFGLWDITTVLIAAGAAGLNLFFKQTVAGEDTPVSLISFVTTLSFLMYIQVFLVGTGRGLKETFSHYIYLIPESPFKKMVWCNLEMMLKASVEGALVCAAAGTVAEIGVIPIILAALVYALFVFLLVAINFVFMRLTGADISAGLLIMFYFLGTLIVMAPGIVLAVIAGTSALGLNGAFLTLAGWELCAALIGFEISKGVLHNCDMAMLRAPGK